MSKSFIRTIAKQAKNKSEIKDVYNSHVNYIFYGETGKSTVCSALSEFTKDPVLLLSPAGGSSLLENDYPNMISVPIANYDELITILEDLENNMKTLQRLRTILLDNDEKKIKSAKDYYEKEGEDWNYIKNLAEEGRFPVSAVVIEELSIISSWIQEKVEDELNKKVGVDKSTLGLDWNILKKQLMDFYQKCLRYPCTTILCTGSKLPGEQQGLTQIQPNICSGAAQRQIIDLIGNVFYFYKEDNGTYKVRLRTSKKVFAKDKILSPKSIQVLPEELELTNHPELFWTTLNDMRFKDIEDRKDGKLIKSGKLGD